jgi:hypothetical protein
MSHGVDHGGDREDQDAALTRRYLDSVGDRATARTGFTASLATLVPSVLSGKVLSLAQP